MAREGGIGISMKNMDIETQAKMVKMVKKSETGVISTRFRSTQMRVLQKLIA